MIAVVVLLLAAAVLLVGVAVVYVLDVLGRRARRRRRALRGLTDREVADALAPFGADISIWPARAPRNGTTYDPVE